MSDNEHKALLEKFYQAFQQRDFKTMGECYHPDATFRDALFNLEGKAIPAMWHMLCERGKDLQLSYVVQQGANGLTVHWEPVYTFSQTGRKVHNIIDAQFEFKDGKIHRHLDSFDLYRWSRQALGLPGILLGWSGLLQNKVRQTANTSLQRFISKHPEYGD